MKLGIIEREYSLSDGFAWVIFSNDNGTEYILQACLKELVKCADEETRYKMVQSNTNLFKKAITANDDGMDWGLSGDANEKAFKKFGVYFCVKLFRQEIKKVGIRFE